MAPRAASGPRITGRRKWFLRLGLAVVAPLLFFLVLEVALRTFGYGYSSSFLVRDPAAQAFIPNPDFSRRFSCDECPTPFAIPMHKTEGTVRIFVFGESAAWGTPEPAFSFARILEVLLRHQYPQTRLEIINTATMGINSHAILPIARECLQQQPDLFLIYMGNNEAAGFAAPGPERFCVARHLWLVRAGLWVRSTRLGQFFKRLLGSTGAAASAEGPQDAEFFRHHRIAPDDPRRLAVVENFRANLNDICRLARRNGVRTILSTVAVNLKDCPPLGSLNRPDLSDEAQQAWETEYRLGIAAEEEGRLPSAISHYSAALATDDHHADLHFRVARCYWGEGKYLESRQHYLAARNWDAMQFRADAAINQAIRDAAVDGSEEGIELVDAEEALNRPTLSERGIAGEDLFFEHVHLTFAGNFELARAMLPAVSAVVGQIVGETATDSGALSQRQCAEALALTPVDELRMQMSMVRLTAKPPFTEQVDHALRQARAESSLKQSFAALGGGDYQRSIELYREAIAKRPEDCLLLVNFGRLLHDLGDHGGAISQWRTAVALAPNLVEARNLIDKTLAERPEGSATEAGAPSKGGALPPLDRRAGSGPKIDRTAWTHFEKGNALGKEGHFEEAVAEYRLALEITPNVANFHHNLGLALLALQRRDEAVRELTTAVEMAPQYGKAHFSLGQALLARNDTAGAIKHFRRALELKVETPALNGQLAWLLATAQGELRDGKEATRLAEEACDKTGRKDPGLLDVLAASYAEQGRFEEAVRMAEAAERLAPDGNESFIGAIRERLDLYKSGKPYRQP